ncbi:hypothetical protein [Methylovorus glucosotrophus]|uniref:Phage-related protein n=1 Tax=Methylovorus glucosotrophus (strain SIP3-4) TaxID=582744 RepID=C6XEE0_METGS|nr:hypothetical protein [Methylovorus glucosotrophus]ACT50915.1 conserved hypothetical protein [Methylovorus glucosotrophus SIP3-4]
MKERPILFSAPMVRALLDGSKTQTRRVVKPQPPSGWDRTCWFSAPVWGWTAQDEPSQTWHKARCPYGQPGDHIWAKETFFAYGRWEMRYSERKGRDERHFVDMTIDCDRAYQYAADNPDIPPATRGSVQPGWYKRPAIFMPRIASRIQLEITCVRVERLIDISEQDAKDEGIFEFSKNGLIDYVKGNVWETANEFSPNCFTGIYALLWESINGPGSWSANPWVWVVEFRRISE